MSVEPSPSQSTSEDQRPTRVRRYSLFPIRDQASWEAYKRQEAALWSSNEINFEEDRKDYDSLSPGLKQMVDVILSFFLPGDGMVNNNLVHRFLRECENMEEMMFFSFQLADECIHAETYSLAAYTFYDDEKIDRLMEEAEASPYTRAKMDFIEKWTDSTRSRAERFFAFSCVEGIFFPSGFLPIFNLRRRGLFKALAFANRLIMGDEGMHRNYSGLKCQRHGGVSREVAIEISMEAYNIERDFVEFELFKVITASGEELPDYTLHDAIEFLKVVVDSNMHCNGQKPLFDVVNPLTWADDLSITEKENFFEIKGGNYTRTSVTDAINWLKRSGRVKGNLSDALHNPLGVDF
jgi:ribonucleoside-diphosphate reductase beta chain